MSFTIAIEAQGQLFALANRSALPPNVKNTRGKVSRFSEASRRRLLRKMARLKATKAVFMTLTFPARYPDPMAAKNHLRAMLERFRRKYPKAACVWRMEAQKRGAPHFHLLWYNLPFVPHAEIRQWWGEITAAYWTDQPPMVHLKLCWNTRQIMGYLSKYVAKEQAEGYSAYDGSCFLDNGAYPHAGRQWGLFSAENLPWAIQVYRVFVGVELGDFERVKALMRTIWSGINERPGRGGCLYTELAYEVAHEAFVTLSN